MVAELLVPIAAVAAVVLILHLVFRVDDDGGDDDDRGSGGGGTKRRPGGGPRTPPPGEQVCWPEFERQFAEYVALSQGRGQRRERARRRADHPDRTMRRRPGGGSIRANRPEGVPMAKPMFFYAGVYDSRDEAKDIGAMLEPGTTALVVVGIDQDAEAIEQAADRARTSTLKRGVGDWDEAEQDALASIARAEQHAAV